MHVHNQSHSRSNFTNIQMMILYESGKTLLQRPTTLPHLNVFVDGLSQKVRLSPGVAKNAVFLPVTLEEFAYLKAE